MILPELKAYAGLLTGVQANFIVYGRNGYDRKNLNWSGIHIDELAIIPTGKNQDFDEDAETMTYVSGYSGAFTFDFYGQNALANAVLFTNLQASQASYEWQRDNGIGVSHASRIINLKAFDRNSNMDRYQVELKSNFNKSTVVATKRIDTLNPLSLVEGGPDFIVDK
jgi:hypothetical protein